MLMLLFAAAAPVPATLSGVVIDRAGKPVSGAVVMAQGWPRRVEAKTDDGGRWTLRTPLGGPALLFVSKEGFRFHGQEMAGGKIVLVRRTEKPTREMKTLPSPVTLEKRRELAMTIAKKEIDAALQSEVKNRWIILEVLARIDPARAVEAVEKRPFRSWLDDFIRLHCVEALIGLDRDEASALTARIKEPAYRVSCLIRLHDALPEPKKAERAKLLADALVESKGMKANEDRITYLAKIAHRLHSLGETAKADALLKEGQKIAKELPTAARGGYTRAVFAGYLARIDKAGAFALLEGLKDDREHVRHHGNLARRLAPLDPDGAEEALKRARKPGGDDWSLRWHRAATCAAMATKHPARAWKLAETMGDLYRIQAHAWMAQALAKSNPKAALSSLDRAFSLIEARVANGEDDWHRSNSAAPNALGLLPIAEAIDPALVPEFLWRSLSFHWPANPASLVRMPLEECGQSVALMSLILARYDRDLARRFLRHAEHLGPRGSALALRAALALDPAPAVRRIADKPLDGAVDMDRLMLAYFLIGPPRDSAEHMAHRLWFGPFSDEDA